MKQRSVCGRVAACTRLAERFASERILDALLHAHAREADAHGADVEPLMIEIVHDDAKTIVFRTD